MSRLCPDTQYFQHRFTILPDVSEPALQEALLQKSENTARPLQERKHGSCSLQMASFPPALQLCWNAAPLTCLFTDLLFCGSPQIRFSVPFCEPLEFL